MAKRTAAGAPHRPVSLFDAFCRRYDITTPALAEAANVSRQHAGRIRRGKVPRVSIGMATRWTFALALALIICAGAHAQQEAYPSYPVRLIAPSGPGGNPDVLARLLADKFTAAFGKQISHDRICRSACRSIAASTRTMFV